MVEVFCSVRMGVGMGVGVGGVGNRRRGVASGGGNASVADSGADGGGIFAGSPMRFLETSGKTSHIVSHSS